MNGWLLRRIGPTSRSRAVTDVLWIASFGVVLAVMFLEPGGPRGGLANGVALELAEGAQRQALFRRGERVGSVQWQVTRTPSGWGVDHRLRVDDQQAARTRLVLRADLSLARLDLEADLRVLARVSRTSAWIAGQLDDLQEISVSGRCSVETGACELSGSVGKHAVDTTVHAGRGPVVTSAIFPLLARGTLGREAEIAVFNPITLSQRHVRFTVEGEELLELPVGTFQAIRIQRDLDAEGMSSRVWVDAQGRVLKEELPLGFVAVHESWSIE